MGFPFGDFGRAMSPPGAAFRTGGAGLPSRSHTRPGGKAPETGPSIDSRESSSTVALASSLHCDRGAKGCMLAQLLQRGSEMSQPYE